MIRVVLADDQALVRSGLRALLANSDDLEVVGDAMLQARGENYPRDVHLAALGLIFETGNPKPRRLGRRLLHHGQMPREIS